MSFFNNLPPANNSSSSTPAPSNPFGGASGGGGLFGQASASKCSLPLRFKRLVLNSSLQQQPIQRLLGVCSVQQNQQVVVCLAVEAQLRLPQPRLRPQEEARSVVEHCLVEGRRTHPRLPRRTHQALCLGVEPHPPLEDLAAAEGCSVPQRLAIKALRVQLNQRPLLVVCVSVFLFEMINERYCD